MFIKAIERVSQFTRPIHSILRTYAGKQVIPSASTLFFVNEDGYALTCKHIAETLLSSEKINNHFQQFKTEKKQIANDPKQKQ